MSESRSRSTFSAYAGASDVPMDFAPVRAEARHIESDTPAQKRSNGSLRLLLLCLILVGAAGIAIHQYRGVAADYLAMLTDSLPALNLPDLNRPVINREINTVRLDSPLHRVTEQEVRTLLARYTESGFLGVDVQDLRDELEQNPWVAHATVRRVWPDVLVINIREQQPIARWGEAALVNTAGEVFTPPLRGPESGLPALTGPEGTESLVLAQHAAFQQALSALGMTLASVSLNERGSWSVEVNEGPLLRLGRDDYMARLERFIAVYRGGLQDHLADARTIDLRYGNGFSVSKNTVATDAVARR
ncbi:MAG: cell division protein FtsQ/DivIB [Pseudohongiella sp.]|uniref:cell division protein FtsQ/DivIB n=1 Tax=Pseudohongiella sp. TaxID=1979412 RepID=UPI0034A03534